MEHLEIALHLGAARCPPQRLERVRQELRRLRRGHGGLLGRWRDLALPDPDGALGAPDERMRRQLVRSLARLDERDRRRLPE